MVDRKNMLLREVGLEKYIQLRNQLLLKNNVVEKDQERYGFAEIIEPLKFDSYERLLEDFAAFHYSRKASVKVKEPTVFKDNEYDSDKWVRVRKRDLDRKTIREFSKIARRNGFLYINFRNSGPYDNEVGFELIENKIKSTNITMPGAQRRFVTWEGSKERYDIIFGLYVPKCVILKSS